MTTKFHLLWLFAVFLIAIAIISTFAADKPASPLVVDKDKRTVSIECKVAPRKLPKLKESYPIEVLATYPTPAGQKAHETVVTFENIKPSEVHQALIELGLKPGKPARRKDEKPQGPEVKVFLEWSGADGKAQRFPIEKTLVNSKSSEPLPPLKWYFTGSVMREPDPEKDEKEYGANLTGTLITLYPVSDDTVLQSSLSAEGEPLLKLETNRDVLPKEGTSVRLVIEAK